MVKVGDKLVVTGSRGHIIRIGSEVTVVKVHLHSLCGMNYCVEDERGLRQWVYNDDLRPISPPQKITQNGYEYELVGPVKPEWLVDGAWVVDKETGRKYQVSCKNGAYMFNNGTREVIIDFTSLTTRFRHHTSSDWKWGDWAMYRGKRVFVIGIAENIGMIAVSSPNIDKDGVDEYDKNHAFIHHSELTPTF